MHISWIHYIHMIVQCLPERSLDQCNYSPRSKDIMVNIQKRCRRWDPGSRGLHINGFYTSRICTYASGVPRWSSLDSSGQLFPISPCSHPSLGSRRPTSNVRPRNAKIRHSPPSRHGVYKREDMFLTWIAKTSSQILLW